jgi:alkylation response protein AidB-like acyl-CoA dehydrogenase
MNFDLTNGQQDIIKAAGKFAEKEFPNFAQECDREEKTTRHLWQKACELGFVGASYPKFTAGRIRIFGTLSHQRGIMAG